MLWSETLIKLLSSEKYLEAKNLIFPLSLAFIILGLGNIINIGIKLAKRSELNLISNIIFFLSTILLFYFFTLNNYFFRDCMEYSFRPSGINNYRILFCSKSFSYEMEVFLNLFFSSIDI